MVYLYSDARDDGKKAKDKINHLISINMLKIYIGVSLLSTMVFVLIGMFLYL